jgi:hypothetical protein
MRGFVVPASRHCDAVAEETTMQFRDTKDITGALIERACHAPNGSVERECIFLLHDAAWVTFFSENELRRGMHSLHAYYNVTINA